MVHSLHTVDSLHLDEINIAYYVLKARDLKALVTVRKNQFFASSFLPLLLH